MTHRPTGPACGNNPNYRMSDGDRQAVETFKAYLAGRAALRDRIAAAIYERNNPGHRWADAHPDDLVCYGNDADAAMSVLPPPVDRAAVLRWAADRYEAILASAAAEHSSDPRYYTGVRDVVLGLRRLADETQPAPAAKEA
jgi:hypothetical protein